MRARAGWEKGRVKECVLEMRVGAPAIIYRITYDDGEEVPPLALPAHSHPSPRPHSELSPITHTGGRGPAHAPGAEN